MDDLEYFEYRRQQGKLALYIFLVMLVVIFGGSALIAITVQSATCSARWSPSATEFGILSGCRVLVDGRLIPEANVRLEQTP